MNDIKVTVCCKTFNHERYIRKALDSFLSQITNFNYEILVHDDASTDNTQKILKEYEEKYPNIIRVIYQKENQFSQGKCVSDFVFPKAKGKYIALCEGDDYWCNDYKLQKQFDILESYENCSACVHTVSTCNEDGTKNEQIKPSLKYGLSNNRVILKKDAAKLFYKEASTKCPFQTSSYFFRKKVIDDFISKNWSIENRKTYDSNMLKMFIVFGDIYYINEIMSTYRINSISSLSLKCKNNRKQIDKDLLCLINEDIYFDKYTKGIYHKYIMAEICNYLLSSKESGFNKLENKKISDSLNIDYLKIIKYSGLKRFIIHLLRLFNFL